MVTQSRSTIDPGLAQRYINMRSDAHTRRHQQALEQWRGDDDSYWESFKASVSRSDTWYEGQCELIDSDQNMNFREKMNERNKLADNRVYPAWSGIGMGVDCGIEGAGCHHSECRWLRTYVGDSQTSLDMKSSLAVQFNALLSAMDPMSNGGIWRGVLRENQPSDIEMTDWERTLFDALVNPRDGSVPVQVATGLAPVATPATSARSSLEPAPAPTTSVEVTETVSTGTTSGSGTATITMAPTAPIPVPRTEDEQAAIIANRTCEFCAKVGKNKLSNTSHQRLCPKNPDRRLLNGGGRKPKVDKEPEEA